MYFLLFVNSEITKVESIISVPFINNGYYKVFLRANQAKEVDVCYKKRIKRQEAFFKLSLHCVRKDKKQPSPLCSRPKTFKAERGCENIAILQRVGCPKTRKKHH